ncbi:uncharacterized protein LTR77_008008 [Saxophila tyrrhenica]|uniref:Uncharacterized protein n=1 Tax=Saxophila tyrrhenica TaxID=1690608 RepID=A0AAV9P3I2_9PEZI|nr:hypothetical protein LTR77_008008 [Saxophila tyrrhenica]
MSAIAVLPEHLTALNVTQARSIVMDESMMYHIPAKKVACQAYSDEDGAWPIGDPFTIASPADFGPEPVPVAAVKCSVQQHVVRHQADNSVYPMPSNDKYKGISLHITTSPQGQNPPTVSPSPVELTKLTDLNGVHASAISLDEGVHPNVRLEDVQCQAFWDKDGRSPMGVAFTLEKGVVFGKNPVKVGSVLCWT